MSQFVVRGDVPNGCSQVRVAIKIQASNEKEAALLAKERYEMTNIDVERQ